MCQISTDFYNILQWTILFKISFFFFLLVWILQHFTFHEAHAPACEAAFTRPLRQSLVSLTLWVQVRVSSSALLCGPDVWFRLKRTSGSEHISCWLFFSFFFFFFFSWRVRPSTNLKGGSKCCLKKKKKSIRLCVINFCSWLWKTGAFPCQVGRDIN